MLKNGNSMGKNQNILDLEKINKQPHTNVFTISKNK